MDLLLKDKNKIVDVVDNLKKNKPEGGTNFFDKMDEFVRDPKNIDMVYHLIDKIKLDYGNSFNLIVTGKFGDWVYNLIKTGKIKVNGIVIHVSGSLRSSIKNKTFQIIQGNEDRVYNQNFVLLDDSYYSGSTKREIDKHLQKYKAKIIKTYVFYDGSFQKRSDVFALYRYYDYHVNDILPVKTLLSVLNNIDEQNIPYDMLENQIMKGQIRSIKELLREIQLLKQKFQNAGSNKVNIKSYGYKREYEKKKVQKYKGFLNEMAGDYKTFDDLEFRPHELYPANSQQAEMTFDNGYNVSVIISNNKHFYSNGKDSYELMIREPDGKVMYGDVLGFCSKDRVNKEMLKAQQIKPKKRVYTEIDPYGEENWDAVKEAIHREWNFSATQFWTKYIREGRANMRAFLKGRYLEFNTKSKGLGKYKGPICGLLPALSKKTGQILILFDTKQHGVLEVDNDKPIIIRDIPVREGIKWYNKGKLGDEEEPEFKINSTFKDMGENDVEYNGLIIRPKKHYNTWQYNIYIRNPKWKKIRNITNFGSEEEAILAAKRYIYEFGRRIQQDHPGNLIEEEVRWYSKGKLGEDDKMDIPDIKFEIGKSVKSTGKNYYWNDGAGDHNITNFAREGNWTENAIDRSWTIHRIGFCENKKGYSGMVIQFKEVWPWFQATNIEPIY